MFRLALAVAFAMCASTAAIAAPVQFVFDIPDRPLEFNAVATHSGAHRMTIVVDTGTPNLGTGVESFRNFYAAEVYFDAPSLGLSFAQVTGTTYLYFGRGIVGFSDTVGGFATIYTAGNPNGSSDDNFDFGGMAGNVAGFDLSQVDIPQFIAGFRINELRTGSDIVFDTGDRITGGALFTGGNIDVGLTRVPAAVPLPPPGIMLGGTVLVLGAVRRVTRRARAGQFVASTPSG